MRSNLVSDEDMHPTILQRRAWYPDSCRHEKGAFRETSKRYFRMYLRSWRDQEDLRREQDRRIQQAAQHPVWGKGHSCLEVLGVGRGKEVPFEELVSLSQENTGLVVSEEFFDCRDTRVYKCKDTSTESSVSSDSEKDMFECLESGCSKSFRNFSELESHLDIEDHCVKEERQSETLYDKLRRDWADIFTTSVNIT